MLKLKTAARWVLGLLMIMAGLAHFTHSATYMALMPSWLPLHFELVLLSGVVESALGAMLLVAATSKLAAWGLVVCFIALFPANLNHALSGGISDPALPAFFASSVVAWVRLPFQGVFIAWAFWMTRPHPLVPSQVDMGHRPVLPRVP